MGIADLQQEVKRLRRGLVIQGTFLFLVSGYVCLTYMLRGISHPQPHFSITGNQARFATINDGPYVITHLASYGQEESEKRWTPLNPPIAVTDSHGADIDLKSLKWRDIFGNETDKPKEGSRIVAFFYRPEVASQFEAKPQP